jgi:hypothetical protein
MNTKDASEIKMDEALMADDPVDFTDEFDIDRNLISEVPVPSPSAVPIPDAFFAEVFAITLEFQIVKLSIVDVAPPKPSAVPIPEPYAEAVASTSEHEIERTPIDEWE